METIKSNQDENLDVGACQAKLESLLSELVMIEDKQRALITLCQEKSMDMDGSGDGFNVHGIMNVFESLSRELAAAIDRLYEPLRELKSSVARA